MIGRRFRGDRGSVTAEFAVVLPAVVLVLVVALGALQLAGEQVRLQSAVASAARLAGRGENGDAELRRAVPGASVVARRHGDLVCERAKAPARFGILVGITLAAASCALDDGQ